VNRVYGHLGDVRHRSEQLEFRAAQHAEILGERLRVLQTDLALPVALPEGTTA